MVKYIWGGIGLVESVSRSADLVFIVGNGEWVDKVLTCLKAGWAGLVRCGS